MVAVEVPTAELVSMQMVIAKVPVVVLQCLLLNWTVRELSLLKCLFLSRTVIHGWSAYC